MASRVLLVDDVAEVRAVLRSALRRRGGFELVGEAGDGASAIALAAELQPDLIVLDLGLPDLAGREVMARLRQVVADAKIVVFTGTETADRRSVCDQADAFVRKDVDVTYLVDLLEHFT